MNKDETLDELTDAPYGPVNLTEFTVFERKAFSSGKLSYNRRDFYKISLMLGTGRLYYSDKGVEIDRPTLIFSNPMIPFAWDPISDDQGGFFCLFTEDFLKAKNNNLVLADSPLFQIGADPVYFINNGQLEYITTIFHNMLSEFNSDYTGKFDLLRNHVNLLLHEGLKMQPSVDYFSHQNGNVRISSIFLELLERQFPIESPQHPLKLKSAKDYANHLAVHVNHLNRAVKEVTGRTTTAHLAERIISEAKALLLHTNWSINDIAYSLGYEHPTYFNNFFKKQTGVTPNSLR